MERPTPSRVASLVTVGLLAALVVTQTAERSGELVVDARLPAILFAAVLFGLRIAKAALLATEYRNGAREAGGRDV